MRSALWRDAEWAARLREAEAQAQRAASILHHELPAADAGIAAALRDRALADAFEPLFFMLPSERCGLSMASAAPKLVKCCPDRARAGACARGVMRRFEDVFPASAPPARLAICTLLTLGDAYLPGVMALAWSVRDRALDRVPSARRHVRMVCVVTADVSAAARRCILTAYDEVLEVGALSVSPARIVHKDPATRVRYSQLLTKLRVFGLTRFAKLLYMDADLLALQADLLDLFTLDAPAAVFYGCTIPVLDPHGAYGRDICPRITPGLRPPPALSRERCATASRSVLKFETALFLCRPSDAQMARVLAAIRAPNAPGAPLTFSDTGLFNHLFGRETHVINANFLGRWQRPAPQMVTLDSYGFKFKPWNDVRAVYHDVAYWRMIFHGHLTAGPGHEARRAAAAAHPAMAAALRVAESSRLASAPCRPGGSLGGPLPRSRRRPSGEALGVAGEGRAGVVACLSRATGRVTKYVAEADYVGHWVWALRTLAPHVAASQAARAMCLMPDPDDVRFAFHAASGEVFLTYDVPWAGTDSDCVPLDVGLRRSPHLEGAALRDLQAWLDVARRAGVWHGDLRARNVLLCVRGASEQGGKSARAAAPAPAPTPPPVLRIIEWEHLRAAVPLQPLQPLQPLNPARELERQGDARALLVALAGGG